MQRFLRRLAWRNLPIAVKTTLLFAVLLVFILALGLVMNSAFASLRSQLETGSTTSVEMRALSQDIQIGIETLQRLESRLVEQRYGWAGFNLVEQSVRREHAALTAQLESDAGQLENLASSLLGAGELVPFSAEVRTIQANARTSEDNFTQIADVVKELTWPEEGALVRFQQYGDQLEALTIQQDNHELISQLLLLRNLERTLTETGTQADLYAFQDAADTYLQIYQTIPLTENITEIPRQMELYTGEAERVSNLLGQLQTLTRSSQLYTEFARDAASRLGTMTEAQRLLQLQRINVIQNTTGRVLAISLIVALIVGSLLTFLYARDLSRSMQRLLAVANALEAGDLGARVAVSGEDEFSRLGLSFNAMATQLEGLVSGLEQRVAERTRDLTITAEIGRAVTFQRDPRDLMNEIVELIRQRFGFYHAQVFLVDDQGVNANLVASTGRAGRELLARHHALEVGSHSVIGQVTSRGEPIVASDTEAAGIVHRRNELLPDTRSEMALPMRIGDRVIGALDVQSVAPNAFDEDVVAVFQIMADQLAIALENRRLQNQLAEVQTQLATLEHRLTGEAWDVYRQSRKESAPLGFVVSGKLIEPHHDDTPAPMSEAIRSGRLIARDSGDGEISLAVPIRVRGEVIGAFGFSGEELHNLSSEDVALIEAIVDRVGLALENLRLIEETARRVEHEHILNEITAKIVGSTDVEQILQTTVRELGRVLRAPQTSVRLRGEGVSS